MSNCTNHNCCEPSPFYAIGDAGVECRTPSSSGGGEVIPKPIIASLEYLCIVEPAITDITHECIVFAAPEITEVTHQCEGEPPVVVEGDMPLDQAVYDVFDNKIFGVRGNQVFRFNAATGEYEDKAVFCDVPYGPSSIAYHEGDTALYVCRWNDNFYGSGSDRKIYKVSPTTLAVLSSIDPDYYEGASSRRDDGPYQILYATNSGNYKLHLLMSHAGGWRYVGFNTASANDYCEAGPAINQGDVFGWDSTNKCILYASGAAAISSLDPENVDGSGIAQSGKITISGMTGVPWAMCHSTYGDGAVYAIDRGTNVLKAQYLPGTATYPYGGAYHGWDGNQLYLNASDCSTIALGITGAKPMRIRSSPYNGYIYIPCVTQNSVVVLNPANDTPIEVTGFDVPFDVVFTDAKAFAVQQGSQALKEISLPT